MKLMTINQYMKMSKPALIRKIMKTLKAMPKKRLAMVCYNITKSKLPRLADFDPKSRMSIKSAYQPQKRKALPYNGRIDKRRKKKRKFSRKQLAAQRLFAKRSRAGSLRKRRRR